MKNLILEEVNRIRELIGVKPLILERQGAIEGLTSIIGDVYGAGGSRVIDDAVRAANKIVRFPGSPVDETLKSWTDLVDYARRVVDPVTGVSATIDDVIPGIADNILSKLLSDSFTSPILTAKVANNIFPENMVKSAKFWDLGALSAEKSQIFRDDWISIVDNINNPQLRKAIDESELGMRIRLNEPTFLETPIETSPTKLRSECNNIKNRVITDSAYDLTLKDLRILDDARLQGIIGESEWKAIMTAKNKNFISYWKLYEEFKRLRSLSPEKGGISKDLSFEDWLVETATAKLPKDKVGAAIKAIRFITQPFLRVVGATKTGNLLPAWLKVIGVTASSILWVFNDLIELGQAGGEVVHEKISALKYKALAEKRWKEYWAQDNPKKSLSNSSPNESIFAEPDGDNYKYLGDPPLPIVVTNGEEQKISIKPKTIKLNGIDVSEFYFQLASTILGYGENTLSSNVDVIRPLKNVPTNNKEEGGKETTPSTTTYEENFNDFKKFLNDNGLSDEDAKNDTAESGYFVANGKDYVYDDSAKTFKVE